MKVALCLSLVCAMGLVACDKPVDDGEVIPSGTLGAAATSISPAVSKSTTADTAGDADPVVTTTTCAHNFCMPAGSSCVPAGTICATSICSAGGCGRTCGALNISPSYTYCSDNPVGAPVSNCCYAWPGRNSCDNGCGPVCFSGYGDCNGQNSDGCEAVINNVTSCGCGGVNCNAVPGVQTGTCSGTGVCGIFICQPNLANCDGIDSNGCEKTINGVTACGCVGINCNNLTNVTGASCSSSGQCSFSGCAAGSANCDGTVSNGCEVNTWTATDCRPNPNQCTAGTNCTTLGHSSPSTCTSGACTVKCDPGYADCDGNPANGCEVNLNDPTTCGTVSGGVCTKVACNSTHGTATCTSGVCGIACTAPYGDCLNGLSDGCETDLSAPASCGMTCGTRVNCNGATGVATSTCTSSRTCTINTCTGTLKDCDGNASNGCEVDTASNASHCGACTTACSSAGASAVACVNSVCAPTCTTNFGNCDGNPTNGCEAPLQTDVNNCNVCSASCSTANISRMCAAGSCNAGKCNSGYTACVKTKAAGGCDTHTDADTSNCGDCGIVCSTNNVQTVTCTGGKCNGPCKTGFKDCNNDETVTGNGCETNINSDPDNCGGCATACAGGNLDARTCTLGMCTGNCLTGWGDCDTNLRTNGCETDLTQTLQHCGTCGIDCSSTELHVAAEQKACTASKCTYTGDCDVGWGDCDKDMATGCEVSLLTAPVNCGTCGNVCPAPTGGTASCTDGTCDFTCGAGLLKCAASSTCATCCGDSDCTSPPNPSDKCIVGACVAGTCSYKPKSCVTTDCYSGVQCDSTTGNCKGTPLTGNSCGQAGCCELGGTCSDGACNCVDGKGKDCTTGLDNCHVGLCSSNGTCATETTPNDTACTLTNLCKLNTQCENGTCIGQDKVCTPSGPCKKSSCTTTTGNCDETNADPGLPCSSMNSCVQNEACDNNGQCTGTVLPDTTPCTNTTCTTTSIKSCMSGVCTCVEPADMTVTGTMDMSINDVVPDLLGTAGADLTAGKGASKKGCSTIPADPSTFSLILIVGLFLRRRARHS